MCICLKVPGVYMCVGSRVKDCLSSPPSVFVFILFFLNLNLFILIGGQLLYNIVLVLPYINMNPPWVYTCSPSWIALPPPSPYHPSGSSQCTSPKHPVSCIEPGLAIHFTYDNIHVSMPFSRTWKQPRCPSADKWIRKLWYIHTME